MPRSIVRFSMMSPKIPAPTRIPAYPHLAHATHAAHLDAAHREPQATPRNLRQPAAEVL
jgi:hypothetical protein